MVVVKDDQDAKSPASLFLFSALSEECGTTIEWTIRSRFVIKI